MFCDFENSRMTVDRPNRVAAFAKTVLRMTLGLGLLACLFWMNREHIANLQTQQIRWGYFVAGFVITLGAMLCTFIRWYLLVVAQGLPFRIHDSLRIGFIGFLFSQVIPGAVSGDLVKVVMLAREQERRTVAVATIILDRIIGLYGLVLLSGLAALFSWQDLRQVAALRDLVMWLVVLVVAGTAGFVLMFMPIFRGPWTEYLYRIPVVGGLVRELLSSIIVYQGKAMVILVSVLLSVVGHLGFVSSLYCVAAGLEGPLWSWRVHFVVAPLGLMINAIPISPGGLGVGEAAMQALFASVGEDGSKAFLMMLAYRAISWSLAIIGVGYLIAGFSETRRAMAEAGRSEPIATQTVPTTPDN
jgi:glycosyltransferase 2 family protein